MILRYILDYDTWVDSSSAVVGVQVPVFVVILPMVLVNLFSLLVLELVPLL